MYVPAFVYVGLAVKLYVPEAVPYLIVAPEQLTEIPCAAPSYVPVYPLADTDNVALFTVTLIVVLVALWFVPAATLTVTVVLPAATGVTVTVVPLILAVAMLVLADDTVIAPSPERVTVLVFALSPYVKVKLVGFTETEPFALLITTCLLPVTVL